MVVHVVGARDQLRNTGMPGSAGRLLAMSILAKLLGVWFGLNLVIPAFIIYQRSPHLRHRLFWRALGVFAMPHEYQLAHQLVEASHHRH